MNDSCRASYNCGGQVAFVFRLPAGQVEFSGLFLTLQLLPFVHAKTSMTGLILIFLTASVDPAVSATDSDTSGAARATEAAGVTNSAANSAATSAADRKWQP